jgi:hypothetical protein
MKRALWTFIGMFLSYCLWAIFFGPVKYDVVVLNTSGKSLDGLAVRFDRFHFPFGVLAAHRGDATFGAHAGPWPEVVEIVWVEAGAPVNVFENDLFEEGSKHVFRAKLIVPARLHARERENLQLVIDFKDGGVHVFPRVRGDLRHGLNYRYE